MTTTALTTPMNVEPLLSTHNEFYLYLSNRLWSEEIPYYVPRTPGGVNLGLNAIYAEGPILVQWLLLALLPPHQIPIQDEDAILVDHYTTIIHRYFTEKRWIPPPEEEPVGEFYTRRWNSNILYPNIISTILGDQDRIREYTGRLLANYMSILFHGVPEEISNYNQLRDNIQQNLAHPQRSTYLAQCGIFANRGRYSVMYNLINQSGLYMTEVEKMAFQRCMERVDTIYYTFLDQMVENERLLLIPPEQVFAAPYNNLVTFRQYIHENPARLSILLGLDGFPPTPGARPQLFTHFINLEPSASSTRWLENPSHLFIPSWSSLASIFARALPAEGIPVPPYLSDTGIETTEPPRPHVRIAAALPRIQTTLEPYRKGRWASPLTGTNQPGRVVSEQHQEWRRLYAYQRIHPPDHIPTFPRHVSRSKRMSAKKGEHMRAARETREIAIYGRGSTKRRISRLVSGALRGILTTQKIPRVKRVSYHAIYFFSQVIDVNPPKLFTQSIVQVIARIALTHLLMSQLRVDRNGLTVFPAEKSSRKYIGRKTIKASDVYFALITGMAFFTDKLKMPDQTEIFLPQYCPEWIAQASPPTLPLEPAVEETIPPFTTEPPPALAPPPTIATTEGEEMELQVESRKRIREEQVPSEGGTEIRELPRRVRAKRSLPSAEAIEPPSAPPSLEAQPEEEALPTTPPPEWTEVFEQFMQAYTTPSPLSLQ